MVTTDSRAEATTAVRSPSVGRLDRPGGALRVAGVGERAGQERHGAGGRERAREEADGEEAGEAPTARAGRPGRPVGHRGIEPGRRCRLDVDVEGWVVGRVHGRPSRPPRGPENLPENAPKRRTSPSRGGPRRGRIADSSRGGRSARLMPRVLVLAPADRRVRQRPAWRRPDPTGGRRPTSALATRLHRRRRPRPDLAATSHRRPRRRRRRPTLPRRPCSSAPATSPSAPTGGDEETADLVDVDRRDRLHPRRQRLRERHVAEFQRLLRPDLGPAIDQGPDEAGRPATTSTTRAGAAGYFRLLRRGAPAIPTKG